jgi:excisionase family DNA binding protein
MEELRAKAPAKELYTLPEAAEFLACSENSVRAWVDSGKMKAVRLDSRMRFRRQDLIRMIEMHTE